MLDDIFGRANYLTTFYVQVRYPAKTLKQDMDFHKEIEQVHIYRRDFAAAPVLNERVSSVEKFRFYIRELSSGVDVLIGGRTVKLFKPTEYTIEERDGSVSGLKEIWASGTILDGNSSGRFFRDHLAGRSEIDGLGALYKVPGIGDDGLGFRYFTGPKRAGATKGKYFQGVPVSQIESPDDTVTLPIENFYDLAGQFGNCRSEGGVEFRSGKKPELHLKTILQHFSSAGDWVLDSFAGSGTTGAVAQKMGRRWIMIEFRDHCHTHIIPRLRNVIDGQDSAGITDSVNWKGGGGFRYYRLAPSLLERDKWGNWVINKAYNAAMLAEALCKLEGFVYAPNEAVYWEHGHSTERDFMYVTTQHLTHEQLLQLSADVGPERSLLVMCTAFRGKADAFPNLTIKKIPRTVLSRCEWGHDDYSLEVANLAPAPEPPGQQGLGFED